MTIKTDSPSILVDCHNHNAENPLWHPHHQYLYWTDIPTGRMFRYYPATNNYEQIYDGESVGGFTIQADGALLLFKTKGTVEIWSDGETTTVIDSIPEAKDTRFNDAIADPEGRVYSGIIATENTDGKLYRLDRDGSYQVMAEDLLVPNGMGFCADYRYFYLTDSDRRTIYRFDYDRTTGNLSNQQAHIVTPEDEGIPDGMTIDSEDGSAWDYFSHEQSLSRAYRWGEDGIAGICDNHQRVCFALAFWNEQDPIIKEKMFGVTSTQGNHGEDVKEYYFYLDNTPTHSYMKYLYKYPQAEYPYERRSHLFKSTVAQSL